MRVSINFSSIILFLCFLASSWANNCIDEKRTFQVEKYSEVIKSVDEEKIYLNTEFLKISEEGIILHTFDGPFKLYTLNSDEQGCFIMQRLKRWKDYYYCSRCNIEFEKKIILECPICNKVDKLTYLRSEFN